MSNQNRYRRTLVSMAIVSSFALSLGGCNDDNTTSGTTERTYSLPNVENITLQPLEMMEEGVKKQYLKITNNGNVAIGNAGWKLYSSWLRGVTPVNDSLINVHVDGQYHYLEPTASFDIIAPGESTQIEVKFPSVLSGHRNLNHQGFHFSQVTENGEETLAGTPVQAEAVIIPNQRAGLASILSARADGRYQSPERVFDKNDELGEAAADVSSSFIPLPKQQTMLGGQLNLTSPVTVVSLDPTLSSELALLTDKMQAVGLDRRLSASAQDSNTIVMQLASDEFLQEKEGAYSIHIDDTNGIMIKGKDSAGIYYAVQSLYRLMLSADKTAGFALQTQQIEDSPSLSHRGLYIDVARHFVNKESISHIIEAMASYKMNKLVLGISNDEGWRLEIPSVPELTEVGSVRGYDAVGAKDDSPFQLFPVWGDGHQQQGGYYSRSDFIELLRVAERNHIDLAIELNLPGHANALVQAATVSTEYNVQDPEDQSSYLSGQGYIGNTINVCVPETYDLVRDILRDISEMYTVAGVDMKLIHFGGDETPPGSWIRSPACHKLPQWDPSWDVNNEEDAEHAHDKMMDHHYLQLVAAASESMPSSVTYSFWHEMADNASDAVKNKQRQFQTWTTEASPSDVPPIPGLELTGFNDDALAILDEKKNVVIANSSVLYLDQPYGVHEDEPGQMWVSVSDTNFIYNFDPKVHMKLEDAHLPYIQGIQAQLWTEAVWEHETAEYLLFPRALAVAERAWSMEPNPNSSWQKFAGIIGQKELSELNKLDIHYRVPTPGAKVSNGMLEANTVFPGLAIHYTFDGSEPTVMSNQYEQPVEVTGEVKLRAFDDQGRASRTITIK